MIRFGPSGNSESFYNEGYKHTYQIFEWINKKGLNAYEYSFGRGVRMKSETAEKIGREAEKYGIALSVHAPYYINLATNDNEKKENNIGYLLESAKALKIMGGKRVVFHPGSFAKMNRETAFSNIKREIKKIVKVFKKNDLKDMLLCPETMGKKRQNGSLKEIMQLCSMDDMIYPTIDFGHLHARGIGAIKTENDYIEILDMMEKSLPKEKYKNFHIHFSKIEYTDAGEKRHRTFSDEGFGPDFFPLAKQLKLRELTPTCICESRGTMAEDAERMKQEYERA